jgi:hypothetical protein
MSTTWYEYSKKTEIKEDDDLRSYINQGLLDGIRV